MRSVVLISRMPLDLTRIRAACKRETCERQSAGRLLVELETGWFAISLDEKLSAELSEEELAAVRRLLPSPCFAALEFSGIEAARMALTLLPTDIDLFIDDDHGQLLSLAETKERLAGNDDRHDRFG